MRSAVKDLKGMVQKNRDYKEEARDDENAIDLDESSNALDQTTISNANPKNYSSQVPQNRSSSIKN
jgi:hypothetical protein